MPVQWTDIADQLIDGHNNTAFLCDIVVPAAGAGDWQRVLDLLHENEIAWQVRYAEDGRSEELPRLAERLLARSEQAAVSISTSIAGLRVNGHVSAEDWIEFDVPARQIDNQESLDALADFVTALGRALAKEVRASPEAAHHAPMFAYDPSIDAVRTP